jgi:mono/diheme cytochrome c family protein
MKKLFLAALILVSCETANYAPPVTPQMAAASSRRQDVDPSTPLRTSLTKLERGRTLFVHRCIECHTLPAIWRYSAQDWPEIVNSMSHRASLKPAERDAVIAYVLAVRAQM